MKFETQQTWELNLRLKRWLKMSQTTYKNKKSKVQNTLDVKQKAKELLKRINL